MARINISADCGNSPKNTLVQQVSIALALSDAALLLDSVTDDIFWEVVGEGTINTKQGLAEALGRVEPDQVAELTIEHVVTHGRAGAVNGSIILMDGAARAFCDVHEFSGAKGTHVKAITSYRIDLH